MPVQHDTDSLLAAPDGTSAGERHKGLHAAVLLSGRHLRAAAAGRMVPLRTGKLREHWADASVWRPLECSWTRVVHCPVTGSNTPARRAIGVRVPDEEESVCCLISSNKVVDLR